MRVDVPTLRCDYCLITTQDLSEMGAYQQIVHYDVGQVSKWDLCPACWKWFSDTLNGDRDE